MTAIRFSLVGLVFLCCLAGYVSLRTLRRSAESTGSTADRSTQPAGRTISPFCLKDTSGAEVALADFKDKKAIVVVFIGMECPLGNLYVLRLAEMHRELGPLGVQILAINSNSQDAPEDVVKH